MRNKTAAIIIIITLVLSLSGCWNRRDPENLALVLATAFDRDRETGMYHITTQIANPLAMGGQDAGQGGGGDKKPFWTLTAGGQLSYQAMRNLTKGISREFFWAHNRIFVLSEELARNGIYPVMDMVERERQLRTSGYVVLADGDVRKLMEAEFPLEETGARGLDRQITTFRYERSPFPVKSMNELYSILAQPGREMFIGRVKVSEDTQQDQPGQGTSATASPPPAIIGGGAVFKGDKMVGWADEQQTIGWAYATGRVFRSALYIKDPVDDTTPLGIGVYNLKSEMHPVSENGRLSIKVDIKAFGILLDIPVYRDLEVDSSYIKSLEQRSAQAIRDAVHSTIALSRELDSDIIGVGNLIYRKLPGLWTQIEDRWYEVFRDIEIDVQAEMNLRRTGLVASPLGADKRR
jgi:spore germination protein KC